MDIQNDLYKMTELIEAYDIPAFIVGSDEKIVYKNEAAKRTRLPVRTGTRIRKYMCGADIDRLSGAETFEPVPVSLKASQTYTCIAQKAGDGFIVRILSLSALSLYRISRFSEYANEKIKSCSLLIRSLIADNKRENILPEISKNISIILKFQAKMADYIRLCDITYREQTVTQSALCCVRSAVDVINSYLSGRSVSLGSEDAKERIGDLFIDVNKADFYSLITYLVSFAVRYFSDRDFKLTVGRFENNAVFSIEGESALSEEEAKAVCFFDPDGIFPAGSEDLMFSVLLSKALASKYGWRFDIVPSGIGYSVIKALVSIPLSDNILPLALHCPEEHPGLITIVETEFCDL